MALNNYENKVNKVKVVDYDAGGPSLLLYNNIKQMAQEESYIHRINR